MGRCELGCIFLDRIALIQGLSGRSIEEGKFEVIASSDPMMSVGKGGEKLGGSGH